MKSELCTKLALTLPVAQKIAAAAEAEARSHGWAVCIAVVDEAGRLVCFLRMDDTVNAAGEIAIAKANHAVNYRRDTKFHEDLVSAGRTQVLALPNAMPIEGGVRLVADGVLIGAIGVSGVQSPQDGQIAAAGAGLLSA